MNVKSFEKNLIGTNFVFFLLTSHFLLLTVITAAPAPVFASEIPAELQGRAVEVQQAVIVEAGQGVAARVSGWERKDSGWIQMLPPVEAVIGKNGLAPAGEKREGDGRTPSGIFELRRAFGYEPNVKTGLEYQAVTEKDFWVDAPASAFYNQWVTGDVPEVSHEILRRPDDLYKYAIVIEYNTDPVIPGMGSAIFMHVWRGADQPTAGCVALAEADVLRFLHWLDARRNPVILLK